MDDQSFDLNLLRVFDAIYRHRNLTRAGDQLDLSQPAVSAALSRLRTRLGDPLFVRSGNGMRETPRAQQLAPAIMRILEQVEQDVLARQAFDPQQTSRRFTILAPDIAEAMFLPPLLKQLERDAPHVSLKTMTLSRDEAAAALEEGKADLAIGYLPDLEKPHYHRQHLFNASHVCLFRSDHPDIAETLTLEAYQGLRHVLVRPAGREHVFEAHVERLSWRQNIVTEVAHFMTLLPLLQETDLVATVPLDLAVMLARHGPLRYIEAPIDLPDIVVHLFWHGRNQGDAAHQWFRRWLFALFSQDRLGRSDLHPPKGNG